MHRFVPTSALFLSAVVLACGEVVKLSEAEKSEFVNQMNTARDAVKEEDPDVGHLSWDEDLATSAREAAGSCSFVHGHASDVGSNNFGSPQKYDSNTAVIDAAVQTWVSEKKVHDQSKSWACMFNMPTCRHYSQVVWKETTNVGCAIAHCPTINNLVVCHFSPRGNVYGQVPYGQ